MSSVVISWGLRFSDNLRTWTLGRILKLCWSSVFIVILRNLFLNLGSEESIPICVDRLSLGLSWCMNNRVLLFFILDSAVINQILSFLKQCFVLGLEHLQLFECIIADLLQFGFILFIDFLLDIFPVIVSEFLFIIEWIESSKLIIQCFCLLLLGSCSRVGSLIDFLGWHSSDSWRSFNILFSSGSSGSLLIV